MYGQNTLGSAWMIAPMASFALLGTTLFGVLAYASLMKAMRTGDVSAVTPFRYTRLVFGLAIGVIFFGKVLTPLMLIGAALVVLSGLVIARS